MADQITGATGSATDVVNSAGGGIGGAGLGGLTGTLQGGLTTMFDSGKSYFDRWFPPEKRNDLMAKLTKFATEKPALASFLLSQLALSGMPLALFFVMTIAVFVFALLGGLVVGVVGALLFTVACVGVALLVLLPILFVTTFAGVFIFLWGWAAYYIIKWFNKKDVPGIHTGLDEGLAEQTGLKGITGDLPGGLPNGTAVEGGKQLPEEKERRNKAHPEGNGSADKKQTHPQSNGSAEKKQTHTPVKQGGQQAQNGSAEKKHPPSSGGHEKSTVGKATGADVGGVAGDVKKKADVGNLTKGKVTDGLL